MTAPLEPGLGAKPRLNVQWKGVDACFDFTCTCGHYQHIDGFTFGRIACEDTDEGKGCGKRYTIEHDATILLREDASHG